MGLFNEISNSLGKFGLKMQKIGPDLGTWVGIGGVVVGTVLACKATLKAKDIIDEYEDVVEDVTVRMEAVEEDGKPAYDPEECQIELKEATRKAGIGLIKAYAPAVIIESLSLFSIFSSHKAMKQRNLALAAAYGVLNRGFKAYRDRVKDELGSEIDYHFAHGTEETVIEEEITDEKTGKTKKKEQKAITIPSDVSMYGRWFDRTCKPRWENNKDYNLTFLLGAQTTLNNLFHARGHLFLNEVYDYLGMPRTPEGQCVGWVEGLGDDFVSFGIMGNGPMDLVDLGDRIVCKKLPNGSVERGADIFCDFNVAGPILDYI